MRTHEEDREVTDLLRRWDHISARLRELQIVIPERPGATPDLAGQLVAILAARTFLVKASRNPAGYPAVYICCAACERGGHSGYVASTGGAGLDLAAIVVQAAAHTCKPPKDITTAKLAGGRGHAGGILPAVEIVSRTTPEAC